MSVFQVQLNNAQQGQLDVIANSTTQPGGVQIVDVTDTVSGTSVTVGSYTYPAGWTNTAAPTGMPNFSLQRTVYVMGPRKINRELKDGQTFTDCNYWKRFCYPQVPLNQAILTCISDDGTIYSDDHIENQYPIAFTLTASGNSPNYPTFISWNASTGAQTVGNAVNFASLTGGNPVAFVTLQNESSTSCQVQLNGLNTAVFTLGGSSTMVFNHGDIQITQIVVWDTTGSTSGTTTVSVIAGVTSLPNS